MKSTYIMGVKMNSENEIKKAIKEAKKKPLELKINKFDKKKYRYIFMDPDLEKVKNIMLEEEAKEAEERAEKARNHLEKSLSD